MILCIDCGSTNHKVALFDESLRRLADCSKAMVYTARDSARVEFEPEQIWKDTIALIRKVCSLANLQTKSIKTIAITSQAQTFTLLDDTGKPTIPFISWADKRATDDAAELAKILGPYFHQHCSFPHPIPQLQISKLLWMARHQHPDALASLRVFPLPSYLAYRLAGQHLTDNNLAAMSGLFSLKENCWWSDGMKACGVTEDSLGGLVSVGEAVPLKTPCADLEFHPDLKIVYAGNDQTAGAFANAADTGCPLITLGTALVTYRHEGTVPGPFNQASCWGPYPGSGYYSLTTQDEGCSALDWAASQITEGRKPEFLTLAETGTPGASLFYPKHIYKEAAWIGAMDAASRARSVLEGICFSVRFLNGENQKLSDQMEQATVIGGGSANLFWLQMLANVLNCRLKRGHRDNLLGAAMMAVPEAEYISGEPELWVDPDEHKAEQYEKLFQDWLKSRGTFCFR